jgi:hypothetical protein
MLALELSVNGKVVSTAGTAGTVSVHCSVSAFGDQLRELKPGIGSVVVRLGGTTHSPNQSAALATWLEANNCSVGDVITLRVIETSDVDQPSITPYPAGIERALVPRRSVIDRLLAFISGGKHAAS